MVIGKEWVNAGELTITDKLIKHDGSLVSIQHIEFEKLSAPVTVYNFEVEDFHTNYAGVLSILVHNANCTNHGSEQASIRGFSDSKIKNILSNPSRKLYQSGGRIVYAKKTGGYYDVVVTNRQGQVITCVGGKTKSLPSWNAVERMLNNQGGYSTLPID